MREIFESTIERLLADTVTPQLLRSCEGGEWPEALWSALTESGFAVAAAPEACGGADASWADLFVVVRCAGKHNLPAPLVETLLANWLLGHCGIEAVHLPLGIDANRSLALVDGRVSGTLVDVPWGRDVKQVVSITAGAQPSVVLLDARQAVVERSMNTAGEPRDRLQFESSVPLALAVLPANTAPDSLLFGAAMMRSAQIAGALHAVLELPTRYAGERVQFGKPIGSFQAIQHQIAVLAEHVIAANMAAEAAFAESGESLAALHRLHARTRAAPFDAPPLVLAQRIRLVHRMVAAHRAGGVREQRSIVLAGFDSRVDDLARLRRSAMTPFLIIERDGAVVTARMNRPQTRNALTEPAQMEEIVDLCQTLRRDGSAKVLVLTGVGTSFCAGGNVKDMKERGGIFAGSPYEVRNSYRDSIQRIPTALYDLDLPVIAAVNGPDAVAVAESFVKVGIVPGDGGAWLLPRVIGLPKASLMAFTGDTIDAAKALEWGLVAQVVPAADLEREALALALRIASNPSHALRLTKRLLREGQHMRLDSLLELSAAYQALAHHTEDHVESVNAFLEKRPAKYNDR